MEASSSSKGSGFRPRDWLVLLGICIAAFAAGGLLRQLGPIGTDVSEQIDLAPLLSDSTAPALGPEDAAVSLVIFTDYQCSACRVSHPDLVAAAKEAGDVRIIYRDYPVFGPNSERAARVALAADNQGLYAQVHAAFMAERRRLDLPVMREIVERLGGDWARIEADLASDSDIEAQIALNMADAIRVGVRGTPTHLIGPYRVVGALSKSEYLDAFDQARERQAEP